MKIDKLALDDEVIRQPELLYHVSEAHVEALASRDYLKEELNRTDAELSNHYRKELAKNGRATDKAVEAKVLSDADRQSAYDEYSEARLKADRLGALKDAFQQRGYMLRDLCSLYTSNYWQEASTKPTQAQDASHYAANRQRMSNARAARNG